MSTYRELVFECTYLSRYVVLVFLLLAQNRHISIESSPTLASDTLYFMYVTLPKVLKLQMSVQKWPFQLINNKLEKPSHSKWIICVFLNFRLQWIGMFIPICGTVWSYRIEHKSSTFSGLLIRKNIKTRDAFKINAPVSCFSDLQEISECALLQFTVN